MPRRSTPTATRIVGAALRAGREARGESREHVAHEAGVTTGTLARLETGKSDPALSTIIDVMKALDMPLSELVERVEAAQRG